MCGIVGILSAPGNHAALVERMAEAIRHRGPDDHGVWSDPPAGVALGHRRLSIVDLSPLGHQPMLSPRTGAVLVFNGEIYNFRALKVELVGEGFSFAGESDTEVLLAACERWGVQEAARRCVGMFAFALYEPDSRVLWLVRDRFGEKPLYIATLPGGLAFASELKALRLVDGIDLSINRSALPVLFHCGYIPGELSIHVGIAKLQPGCLIRYEVGGPIPESRAWWSPLESARVGSRGRFTGSLDRATDRLEELLGEAVSGQMVADVPIGAFLSGGIDSSLIVALMQRRCSRPVRTFSIGFAEAAFDESVHAERVARHLGTDHTTFRLSPDEAKAAIPDLARTWDEPFADSSQVPTLLLSRYARRHVTVCLTGDGGDELFGGYTRYFMGRSWWKRLGRYPGWLRRGGRAVLGAVPGLAWRMLSVLLRKRFPDGLGAKALRLHALLGCGSLLEVDDWLLAHWRNGEAVALGGCMPVRPRQAAALAGLSDPIELLQLADQLQYLPDDILVKVDRASMAASLETRVPLLDHRVAEFAWSLPPTMKADGGPGKAILRTLLARHVPPALFERPKQGFCMPVDEWLRGPLRDWAEDLLGESRLRSQGMLDVGIVRTAWDQHLTRRMNNQSPLWGVLMFQAWLDGQRR